MSRWCTIVSVLVCHLAAACGSNHHVSPWPRDVSLHTLLRPGDIDSHVIRIDEEMRVEGLVLDVELDGELEGGEPFRIRTYRGHDDLGNERRALRVATRFGVVMALGPATAHEAMRGQQVTFVRSLGEGTWQSGTDINGDGLPDVVVDRAGVIEIWGLHAQGASPYPVDSLAPITGTLDVDADGRPDLVGRIQVPEGDALAPRLVEVVTFSEGRYHHATEPVRAFHARALADMDAAGAPARRIEAAWHRLRSGHGSKDVLALLDTNDVDETVRASFARWRAWIASHVGRGAPGDDR